MFKNEEGFSLLELVVAVGVAGIIAAVALPTFAGLQDKATTTSATYAASASAAEALANSTIGNTGGNGSASTTGGASSSSQTSALWGPTDNWSESMGVTINLNGMTSIPAELANGGYVNYNVVFTGGNHAGTYAITGVMGPDPMMGSLNVKLNFENLPTFNGNSWGTQGTGSSGAYPVDSGLLSIVAK